jgi:threonyl-tRNA synthetase
MQLENMRHSLSHIMAQAVLKLYPNAKMAIGPAIDNGFYYDFDLGEDSFAPEDLKKIQKEMKKIIGGTQTFEQFKLSVAEAKKKLKDNPYKIEMIDDLVKEGEKEISFYKNINAKGEEVFVDMCSGPHLETTKEIGAFKLDKLAGAYWRGDEKNKMLQRIYGLAFEKKEELDEYLKMMEEAAKRDHRKLGKELDLFHFSDLVGSGLPLYTPKGTILVEELQKELERISRKYHVGRVMTPHIAKIDLFKLSGHADKFGDELFHVQSHHKQDFVMKPVQCPHQTQIYASKPRSYRDLPIRYMETNKQYRDEKPGEISGLTRVVAITIDDGHHFCTVAQIKDEAKILINIIQEFYKSIGLWGNHWVSLSVRDYDHPEKYIGEPKDWDKCEQMLEEIADEMKLDAKRIEGEAALYGPKLDFMFKDALGTERQLATVQLDFATPKRFNLLYTDEQGKEVSPVMVHRAILGSYERFIAILIEHFAGAFPAWLSPEQIRILPVSEKFDDYATEVCQELYDLGFRVEIDNESESLNKRIRNAEKSKLPYILVIGEKEQADKTVAVRKRKQGDLGATALKDFISQLNSEIEEKK